MVAAVCLELLLSDNCCTLDRLCIPLKLKIATKVMAADADDEDVADGAVEVSDNGAYAVAAASAAGG